MEPHRRLEPDWIGRYRVLSTLGHGDPSSIFGRLPRPEFAKFNAIV